MELLVQFDMVSETSSIEIENIWVEHCIAACWFDMELPCSCVGFEVHAKGLTNFLGIFGTPLFYLTV